MSDQDQDTESTAEHGTDLEADTELSTVEDDQDGAVEDVDPTPERVTGEADPEREAEAADQANPDDHRDEPPTESQGREARRTGPEH